jgi:hypothetical protein
MHESAPWSVSYTYSDLPLCGHVVDKPSRTNARIGQFWRSLTRSSARCGPGQLILAPYPSSYGPPMVHGAVPIQPVNASPGPAVAV